MTPLREGMTQDRHQGMPTTDFIVEQAKGCAHNIWLLLAHGAGAPMDSDYLQTLTGLLLVAAARLVENDSEQVEPVLA